MTAKRGRGRPAFAPTAAQRRTVEEMISCGETKRSVYLALGIDEATLNKHFAVELETGGAKKRKELLGLLWKQARKGNATCIKKLEDMQRIALSADAKAGNEPKAQKLGKKEERQANADRVSSGGVYAVPNAPRLAIDNTR